MSDDYLEEENIVSRLNLFEETGSTDYQPLTEAVKEYVEFSLHPEKRIWTGVKEIDEATRGIAPGEFCQINGFAHNGKTVLVIELILANEGRPCILFTPDETRMAVLIKLAAAICSISAIEFERRIFDGDTEVIQQLNDVAERFKELAVYDDSISLHTMDRAWESVVHTVGQPDYCIFDFSDLLDEDMEPASKMRALKAWGKDKQVPFVCLVQSSKSAGGGGKAVTIESGSHDRGDVGTFIIGVRRKINMLVDQVRVLEEKLENTQNPTMADKLMDKIVDIKEDLIPRHRNTITVNLVKNKRPPMLKVDEIDFHLQQDTGRLVRIYKDAPEDEPPIPFSKSLTAKELLAERDA